MNTVGIDIGGTQLRAAIFDENYQMLDVFKTDNDRTLTAQQNMDKLLNFLLAKGEEFRGIGIGCPGPLDIRAGKILTPPNLFGWDHFAIVPYVEARTQMRALLNNDANVAGLAEARLGSAVGMESVVYVGLSTGVGGAFVYQGRLVNGAHSNAAELWNMIVSEDTHCHKNANPGSLNEQCSGSGLEQIAAEQYGRRISPRELFEKFYAGDARAAEIVEHGAEALAKGIANIMCTIDPDVIVVGGSVAIYNPVYIDMAAERARKYLIAPETLQIVRAKFGDDAGLIGAALLV